MGRPIGDRLRERSVRGRSRALNAALATSILLSGCDAVRKPGRLRGCVAGNYAVDLDGRTGVVVGEDDDDGG